MSHHSLHLSLASLAADSGCLLPPLPFPLVATYAIPSRASVLPSLFPPSLSFSRHPFRPHFRPHFTASELLCTLSSHKRPSAHRTASRHPLPDQHRSLISAALDLCRA